MRHDQPTTPFDVEADELTEQFWGASKGWVSSEQPTVPRAARSARSDDTTGSLRAIRDGFAAFRPRTSANATGEIRRQRHHGPPSASAPDPADPMRREATLGELAAGRSDLGGWLDDDPVDDAFPEPTRRHSAVGRQVREHEEWEHDEPDYDVPLSPVQPLVDRLGLGAVDPLLVRAGMVALALVLLVPLMLSLRPDRDDTLPGDVVEAPQPAVGAAPPATDTVPTEAIDPGAAPPAIPVTTASAVPDSVGGADRSPVLAEPVSDRSAVETATTVAPADAASVDVAAERLVPACTRTYAAAVGDSWYRIADEADVGPGELLAENGATIDTVILPGDEICLPDGATMPTPPTTVVSPVEDDADEAAASDTAADSSTPDTTVAPTTIAPVSNLSPAEVQDLIRSTWPAEEVDKALAVAKRESKFIATADNGWCCVGVFQIYWTVHRGWLDDFGIAERADLFDARKNIAAAYHMWQTQGWGPWGG